MQNEDLDFSQIKKTLIATKAADIEDFQSFVEIFLKLNYAVVNNHNVDKSSILVIDTLTIWLLRAGQYVRAREVLLNNDEFRPEYLTNLFQFVCDYYDTGLGALSNAMTALLTRLCQFSTNLGDVDGGFYLEWIQGVLDLPMTLKSYFVIVDILCKETGPLAELLLKMNPELSDEYIKMIGYDALANVASKTFATIHMRARGPDKYMDSWKTPVIVGLSSPTTRSNIASHLLPILFRGFPDLYIEFLQEIRLTKDSDIFLSVAKIGYSIVSNFEEVDNFNEVLRATTSADASKRLDALEVIVGCVRSTRMTSPEILNTILSHLWLEVFFRESVTPQLRNRFATLIKKAMVALRDYIYKCEKTLKMNPEDIDSKNNRLLTIHALVAIRDFVHRQLSPSSSYCQLILTTDLLQIFIDNEFDGIVRTKRKHKPFKVIDIFTLDFVQVLLRMTSNNYDDIRQRVSGILLSCPYSLVVFQNWDEYSRNTMRLLSSFKGRQSDSAAQVFVTLTKVFQGYDETKYLDLLSSLHEALKNEQGSIHGYFTTFTYILSLEPPISKFHEYFKHLVSSLLEKIINSWNYFKKLTTEHDQSWRLIKEASGLLRVLMDMNSKSDFKFFSKDRFLSVYEVIINQLATVTHRGAFSAINLTFVDACTICLQHGLQKNLDDWLKDNLNFIQTHSQMISRRSGGLPFMITGILSGLTNNPDHLRISLDTTFNELLRVASEEYIFGGEEKVDIPQVHAFNCMKHIFSGFSSTLVDQHICSALEVSLHNLDHKSWSLKNAAVMLYTSLQLRIFGSNQLGNTLLKMNSSLFFLKYPGISLILLEKLERSESVDVLIPILSILSRLTSHKTDDERIRAFLDILEERFLGHRVWKVREMAALVITSLTHCTKLSSRAVWFIDQISLEKSNNKIHGMLRCVSKMLQVVKQNDDDITGIVDGTAKCFILLESKRISKWLLLSACLKVWEYDIPREKTIQKLKSFFSLNLANTPQYPDALRRLCLKLLAGIIIRADSINQNVSSMVDFTKKAMSSPDDYEVLFAYLDFWENPALQFNVNEIKQSAKTLGEKLLEEQSFVTVRVLDFLVNQGLSLDVKAQTKIPDIATPLFFLQINDSTSYQNDIDLLRKYSDDEQEKTRLSSVHAAHLIITHSGCGSVGAESTFLLFRKLFDASFEVRQASATCLARILDLDSNEIVTTSQRFINCFVTQYKEHATAILSRECRTIEQSLDDAMKDLTSQFDVENDNLYMDEVSYHRLLVSGLKDEEGDIHRDCIEDIRLIVLRAPELRSVLVSWTYSYHMHCAIQKALNYATLPDNEGKIADNLKSMREVLLSMGYPVGENA